MKPVPRIPKDYDGIEPPGRRMDSLLDALLDDLERSKKQSLDSIAKVFEEIVGGKIAPMIKVVNFQKGVLFVKVKNATLLSILSSQEKPRLLQNLRDKLPNIQFTNLVFQFG
jgi:hypothetical protein